ncbi:hypothetical protein [Kandleria sp.]|uniref:hypothetical protein n=1 Tax=Kandleria sp. TaxID=2774291 RepID=UPI001B3F07A2|nr:hypothetical protein [Kandleria sp.]MBP3276003.1 hypothetical protein [Kandleria sp.]
MLETLLKKRDFPLIVFLGYPQTILDVISLIVYFIHCYVSLVLKAPSFVSLLFLIYFIVVYYIIKNNTDNKKYRISLDLAKSGSVFCVISFLFKIIIK